MVRNNCSLVKVCKNCYTNNKIYVEISIPYIITSILGYALGRNYFSSFKITTSFLL
jgi:hypothetical protein